ARRGVRLSALLAVTALAGNASAATVPSLLVAATVELAHSVAVCGTVPAHIASLLYKAAQQMIAKKLKLLVMCLIPLALAAGGTAVAIRYGKATKPQPS